MPFAPPTAWRGISVSTSQPNASTVTSLATIHWSALKNLFAASVYNHPFQGIICTPQLPALRAATYVHTGHQFVSTVVVCMN
jgi:hypothetical protein